MNSWEKIYSLIYPRRLLYAKIAGITLWVTWIASLIFGSGNFDLAGQVVGTDYVQFYAAGSTLLMGDSAKLFDYAYQSSLEMEIIGPELSSFHAFITPPLFAVLYIPFALLPYTMSYVLWSIFSVLLLWLSVKLLPNGNHGNYLRWALIYFPIFATISFGQNSLLSVAILCLTYERWNKQKYFQSGLIASLIFYKPQLIIGVLLLWLLDLKNQRSALTGFILGFLVIIVLNSVLFPDASLTYWNFIINGLPSMISQEQFPIWHMHTMRGFWMMLLERRAFIADILYILCTIIIVTIFIKMYKHLYPNTRIKFAAAICLTILVTPHAMIYDWSLLIIPAILLWGLSEIPKQFLIVIFSLMWIVTFISGPLTYVQLKFLPIAIQVSIPAFLLASIFSSKYIITETKLIKQSDAA